MKDSVFSLRINEVNKKILLPAIGIFTLLSVGCFFVFGQEAVRSQTASESVHEAAFDAEPSPARMAALFVGKGRNYSIEELNSYERTPGPWRVGIQVGHWQNDTMPDELKALEYNGGAAWGGLSEAAAMYEIVEATAAKLEAAGVIVDVLPATIPKGYRADAFISVHADGNRDTSISGFKIAGPRRDYSGRSEALVEALYTSYEAATGMSEDSAITNRMTAYYAFNWPRYEHAVHPHTPSVIVETGFLTSAVDRAVIVATPEVPAAGIVEGVLAFLNNTNEYQVRQIAVPTLPLVGEVVCAPLRAERRTSTRTYDCLPSVESSEGLFVALYGVGSSTPLIGQSVTTSGEYMPAQTLDTYFWFPYDIVGLVVDEALQEKE